MRARFVHSKQSLEHFCLATPRTAQPQSAKDQSARGRTVHGAKKPKDEIRMTENIRNPNFEIFFTSIVSDRVRLRWPTPKSPETRGPARRPEIPWPDVLWHSARPSPERCRRCGLPGTYQTGLLRLAGRRTTGWPLPAQICHPPPARQAIATRATDRRTSPTKGNGPTASLDITSARNSCSEILCAAPAPSPPASTPTRPEPRRLVSAASG